MNLLASVPFLKAKSKAPRQVISDSWENRGSILESDVNLFCWKRQPTPNISAYLAQLSHQELKPIRSYLRLSELDGCIGEARANWDLNTCEASDLFWQDVSELTQDFLSYSKDGCGTLHLKMISDDACTKFHTDGYSLRLFTTYYGKGTEWLPEKAVNRSALGKSNDLIVQDASQIQRMDAFEVGILKGEIPGKASSVKGIVHRSPRITQSGEKRIILRLDI